MVSEARKIGHFRITFSFTFKACSGAHLFVQELALGHLPFIGTGWSVQS